MKPYIVRGVVVSIGAKVPRIRININDPDYEQKKAYPENWSPAVIVKFWHFSGPTPVCISAEEEPFVKKGDYVYVDMQSRRWENRRAQ